MKSQGSRSKSRTRPQPLLPPQPQHLRPLHELWVKPWTRAFGVAKVVLGGLVVSSQEVFHYIGKMVTDPSVRVSLDSLQLPVWFGLTLTVLGFITLASMPHGENA